MRDSIDDRQRLQEVWPKLNALIRDLIAVDVKPLD
jgi:hypothetical protein